MRILVVEDEKKVLNFVSKGLKSEGFAVDTAKEGREGLEYARTYNYDLLVLDVVLPYITGTEILSRIRSEGQKVPVLMLTAKDSVADKVLHFNAEADDYLTKPFSFAELLARIKALLRRGNLTQSNLVTIADLEIDRLCHQVKRSSQKIELSSKEYALLEYLALNANRVLSRTMIIEHIWDQSFEGFTNIVDVYIRQLRSKIDDPFPTKLIKTIRGLGYSLRDEK